MAMNAWAGGDPKRAPGRGVFARRTDGGSLYLQVSESQFLTCTDVPDGRSHTGAFVHQEPR